MSANGDERTLETILDLLAQDRPEGLNWPGVARLVRRALAASPASPAAQPDPLQGLRDAKYLNPRCASDGCQFLNVPQLNDLPPSLRASIELFRENPDEWHAEWTRKHEFNCKMLEISRRSASPAAAEWREHQEIFVAAIRTLREQSRVESNCMASSFAYRENQHTFMVQLDDALAIIDEPPASPLAATLEHK